MTTAEKLTKVAEGLEKTQELNTDLEKIINGGDTGYKSHYDRFWDAYQQNGTRTDYRNAFYSGDGSYSPWDDELFKPKYDIKPILAGNMFVKCKITNLKALLEKLGRIMDFSKVTNVASLFNSAITVTHLPKMDFSLATDVSSAFAYASSLHTIDELILGEQITTFSSTFVSCKSLENVTIKGTIKINGFNVQWSTKLSKASITSIINALSTTTSGLTVTLSKTAKEAAFTTEEWNALVATRTNWTISLV